MILSQKKIEEIAVAVTKDFNEFFFGSETKDIRRMARGTPIDQFAKEYLGLEVSFAHLSPDGSICGLTAYADTEYITEEMGVKRTIPLRKNQILMDTSFIQPGQVQKLCGKRRFTLAHECAHQILFQMESETAQSAYAKKYSARTVYSLRDLKTREDWNEWQASCCRRCCICHSLHRRRRLTDFAAKPPHSRRRHKTRQCKPGAASK